MELNEFTDADLQKELDRRKKLRNKVRIEERHQKTQHWFENIDHILALTEHSRTTCSDATPINSDRCTRCKLLEFQRSSYWDDEYIIELIFHRSPVEIEE